MILLMAAATLTVPFPGADLLHIVKMKWGSINLDFFMNPKPEKPGGMANGIAGSAI
jgi:hypothetical protein